MLAASSPSFVYLACGDGNAEVFQPGTTSGTGAGLAGGGTTGQGGAAGHGGTSTQGGSGQTTTSPGGAPPGMADCAGKIYQCTDGLDNDDDGLIDAQDPDCLGPCDNTEDSYYPNLPGAPGGPCALDCFWDTGNGSGNDDCYWDHRCDPLEVAPGYPPEGELCAYDPATKIKPGSCEVAQQKQSQMCTDYCAPLTPNGCDCFGCCELPAGSKKYVWLGSADADKNGTCTIDAVGDPEKCKPCTVVPGCFNDCGKCEYCLGKTELPPECFDLDAGEPDQCPPEWQACGGPNQDPCPPGEYCITGCCVPTPK